MNSEVLSSGWYVRVDPDAESSPIQAHVYSEITPQSSSDRHMQKLYNIAWAPLNESDVR